VRHTGHNANPASTSKTGFFAVLGGLLRVKGSAARMPIFLAMMLFALLALSATPAFAVKEYVPGITFGAPCGAGEVPCGPGKFKEPSGVAVNDSSEPLTEPAAGDVYVVDTGDNRVERFTSTGVFQGQFDGGSEFEVEPGVTKATPAPPQPLAAPEYVAVDDSGKTKLEDPSVGDVYVTDNGHHAVDRFTPAGEYLGQLTGTCPSENESQAAGECVPSGVAVTPFGELLGIAVGAAGEVWVHDNTGHFDEFTNTGVYTATFKHGAWKQPGGLALDSEGDIYSTFGEAREGSKLSPSGEVEAEFAGSGVSGLAVASLTNDVLVDKASGLELYGPIVESGQVRVQPFATGLAESHGIAVNSTSATQTVYASERTANDVRAFNYVTFPTVTAPSAVEVSNTVETLGGTVEPEGEAVTECRFEYGLAEAEPGGYEHSAPCEQSPEDITGTTVPVSAKIEGLTPGATYHYRLDLSNKNGTGNSKDATFTLFPVVGGGSFSGVGSSSAVVHATVEPGGVPTSYFFEYGTSTEYGSHTTVESAGASSDTVAVSASLEGLAPDTTYHFRVVASSTEGTVRGADASFSTFPLAISGLPDGRGYELVSPLENGYAEVVSGTRAAADGSAVAYQGQASEQGGNGNNGGPNETGVSAGSGSNEYLASRSSTGWTAADIQPPGLASVGYQAFSAELSTALLASSEPLVPGAPAESALYSRRSATGGFTLLGAGASYSASTPDGQHVLYSTGVAGLFETGVGAPAAVNVLAEGGSAAHAVFGAPTRNVVSANSIVGPFGPDLSNAVSADGSRVFWTETDAEGDPLRLFVTEHAGSPAARTVPLDASQFEGHAGGEGRFVTASADGSRVFFTDCNQLTADSTAVPVSRCEEVVERSGEFVSTPKGDDLYEYDLSTGTLTDLTVAAGEEHAQVVGVLGSSADGSYVYFAAGGVLAGGASPQECLQPSPAELGQGIETKCNVYMVHDGGAPVFVAALSSHDWADWGTVLGQDTAHVAPASGALVFTSRLDLAAFRAHAQHEIYMFTTATGVSCLSCNPSGALTPPGSGASLPGSGSTTFALRDVSADGTWVFFETAEGLVPQDGNGKTDVYEWERDGTGSCTRAAGCLYLISGGTSSHNSHFVDASENGNDVFFISDAELVPADRGEYTQVYDARVGATEALAQTACTGTGCQGVPPAPPIFATPSSVTFSGVGNFPPAPSVVKPKPKTVKCPKGKTRNKHNQCVKSKKHKAKAKKSAHINRRAPR
jgi:hypothetical protein